MNGPRIAMWEAQKERISSLPAFEGLLNRLRQPGARIPVAGLSGSSRSLVLAALLPHIDRPVVVVAPDQVSARDIEWELKAFGAGAVLPYPEDEILPYDYHDPDRNLTGMQMRALEEMSAGRCRVLVCTVRSLLKKVFPGELFESLLIDLENGSSRDPWEIAEELVRLGYERHEIVEDKGQFALRGGILDVFEISSEDPVRMEFDGDEIVSMRDFDVETQRSTGERPGLRIRPFHHLVPDEAGLKRLRGFLASECGDLTEEQRLRMMLPAERLESGNHFYGMEHYASIVHEVVPVYEYFDRAPLFVSWDSEEARRESGEFREEIRLRHERSREKEHCYPPPDSVYVSEAGIEEKLAEGGGIDFGSLPSEGAVRFFSSPAGDYRRNLKGLITDIRKELSSGMQVFLFSSTAVQRERAEEILAEVSIEVDFPEGFISSGFRWPDAGLLFLGEEEVFGRFHRPWHSPRARSRSLTYDPSHFQPGDFVVHEGHGIGRYMGMRVVDVEGGQTECLDIRYEGDDRLFIPVSQLRMVEKYLASEGAQPKLATLGSRAWNRARERARESAGRVAEDLLEIYAARQMARGFAFGPDKPWQREMEASFPWEETAHQLQATSEVKADLETVRPMDRLLCGDVGFGKTEVAVRAAFKVVVEGKQAVFLVPTTVLALQHYNTLRERLAGFPVRVEMLSRFVPPARQKQIVADLAEGKVDIAVGTHRLISRDVKFSDLGLVVVDEEHRFGVRQKEAFKKMKKSVDVLSMTATPIPRTLSMALSGIRDISVIDTPPRNRLPIQTEILPFDDERIREAVMRELGRGGQVFFVHNRVQSIRVMEGYLARLLPDRVRIAHAHGQMKERELERIMVDFLDRKFDLLLCTMIIEAGLDFPNVNTIIINRADRFGLAQLYQLRGRVGRSDRKAYAYMLTPKGRTLTATAIKRLQAIGEFDYLGAGYRIAMRDLEIRGAGNLLGHQQSGQINAVGLDLYSRMIREEVARMRGEPLPEERQASISIPLPAYLPSEYITDSEERMEIYRRLTAVSSPDEVDEVREELSDRFGRLPPPALGMLRLVRLKARATRAGMESAEASPKGALRAAFAPGFNPARELLARLAEEFAGRLTFHVENDFSLTLEGGEGAEGAASALERLLNLLEFYDK